MSDRESKVFSLTSGLLITPLEVGFGLQDALEREVNDPRSKSWNHQNGQLQKTFRKSPSMSSRELNVFSLTSGKYNAIYLILWIISTIREKEVPTLQ